MAREVSGFPAVLYGGDREKNARIGCTECIVSTPPCHAFCEPGDGRSNAHAYPCPTTLVCPRRTRVKVPTGPSKGCGSQWSSAGGDGSGAGPTKGRGRWWSSADSGGGALGPIQGLGEKWSGRGPSKRYMLPSPCWLRRPPPSPQGWAGHSVQWSLPGCMQTPLCSSKLHSRLWNSPPHPWKGRERRKGEEWRLGKWRRV